MRATCLGITALVCLSTWGCSSTDAGAPEPAPLVPQANASGAPTDDRTSGGSAAEPAGPVAGNGDDGPRGQRVQSAKATLDSFVCPDTTAAFTDGVNRGFSVAGKARAFHLALPKVAGKKPIGVIFSWHGVGDSVDNWRKYFSPDPDADAEFPFAVVTPEDAGLQITGTPQGLTWDILDSKTGDDNLEAALFEGILGCLNKTMAIDPAHVHAVGFSGGAIVTGLLHSRYSSVLHSVVQMSGAWFNNRETVDGVKANLEQAAPAAKRFGVDLTNVTLEWSPLVESSSGVLLTSRGGSKDVYAVAGMKVIDFEQSAAFARPFLRANARQIIDCPHDGGHVTPRFIDEQVIVSFLKANPLTDKPAAPAMPESLRSHCAWVD